MKLFYFVGEPKHGQAEEFFQRLGEIGGSAAGWQIYPHKGDDGKALHIVETDSDQDILNHLDHFRDIYEQSDIMEICCRINECQGISHYRNQADLNIVVGH